MKKRLLILLNLIMIACIAGCGKGPAAPDEEPPVIEEVTRFIYSDTCIVTSIDVSQKEITFQNIDTGKRYTLKFDNLTFFNDRHGNALTSAQIKTGIICDISFYRENKTLKTLDISDKYFNISNVDSFRFYNNGTRMEYLGDKYDLDDFVVVCSGNENISPMEIAEGDILSINGYDHTIYSITLDKGHGYVSIANGDYFIDGYIEIGKNIRKITKDMVLTIPEGIYDVTISKDGSSGVKSVTVGRNQEVAIDASDIEIVKKYGNVRFVIDPEDASVYIDGEKVEDLNLPVNLEYGVYQLIVRADGYETASNMLSVGSKDATIELTLTKFDKDNADGEDADATDEKKDDTNKKDDASSDSSNDDASKDDNTESKKVYINAPTGAEVYVDGNYIGTVPTSFVKKAGTIVITLRKEGCQTRSYTINFEDANEDSTYTFSDLLKVEE